MSIFYADPVESGPFDSSLEPDAVSIDVSLDAMFFEDQPGCTPRHY